MAEAFAGARYVPAAGFQSPTPIVIRTVLRPGSQAECGTRTSIWRRLRSTLAVGAGVFGVPVAASISSALDPCTVRNSEAGEETPAPWGHGSAAAEFPSAIVNATRLGSCSVLSVTRKAVSVASGRTRISTRSAALLA